MVDENTLLLPGECKLGRYHVAILRHSSTGWVPTTPPVNILVTNYRLVLHPQTRRKYQPAVIPSTFITQVSKAEMGYHKGVRIGLKNGMWLYLTINWSESQELTEAVKKMLVSPIGNTFIPNPAQAELNRLIEFISRL